VVASRLPADAVFGVFGTVANGQQLARTALVNRPSLSPTTTRTSLSLSIIYDVHVFLCVVRRNVGGCSDQLSCVGHTTS